MFATAVTTSRRARAGLASLARAAHCALVAMIMLLAAGCSGSSNADSDAGRASGPANYPYVVTTTCGMVTDIVRIVAGDKAEVTGIMGEGVDPHLYKPTRGDIQRLLAADLVFYNGLMLEGRMADDLTKVARRNGRVYAVSEAIDESFLREPPEFEGHWDPHVWMDVSAWSQAVTLVADVLSEYDPANAEEYRNRSEQLQTELTQLHEYARESIASIPSDQRVLITAHDAFGYFSRAYDIPVRSVQGLSTESEAGVDDLNQLVDFIVDGKIGAIFVESSVSRKNVQAIVEGAAARGHEVRIGGELFSDAMGAPGTYEGTYVGMLDHNATVITRALGGEAPADGLNGKLAAATLPGEDNSTP